MDIEILETFLDRYGTDPSHWPNSDERKRMDKLLVESESARRVLEENRRLHRTLDVAMTAPTAYGIPARVLNAISLDSKSWWTSTLANWLWKPALVALPLTMGFLAGNFGTDPSMQVEDDLAFDQFVDHSDLVVMSDE